MKISLMLCLRFFLFAASGGTSGLLLLLMGSCMLCQGGDVAPQSPDAAPIPFTLDSPGRVSLGIYDGKGRRIRELLRADERAAGKHTVWWDGLDRDGRPQTGLFEWRLAQSQGLKSEYLMSVGTSMRENFWPAQHGPLCAVQTDGSRIFVTAGMSEGAPQTACMGIDGKWRWVSGPTGGWMGGNDLALDGDTLYFLGGPMNADARLFVQQAENGQGKPGLRNTTEDSGGFSPNWHVEKYDHPRRVDARGGELVVAAPSGLIVWLDPLTGQELDRLSINGGLADVALLGGGRVLAISGNSVIEAARGKDERAVRITGLNSPKHLSVDPNCGKIFIAEGGASQQIKVFDSSYKPQGVFGRAGGRKTGLYQAADFRDVSGIAGDGTGGFVVVETSAPRRTAHFDSGGKLINEWYGGQDFYTYMSPEPDNPNFLWMSSAGWLTQIEADYKAHTWRPRATYRFDESIDPNLITGKPNYPYVKKLDLTETGKRETYIWARWTNPLLLKIDEKGGRLQPLAAMETMPARFVLPPARNQRIALGTAGDCDSWRVDTEVLWRIFNAGQNGRLEIMDADDKPIVSVKMFRGVPIKDVTADAGHATYLVFNDRELMNQKSSDWPLTSRSQPLSIKVADGRAIITYGPAVSGTDKPITLERPVLAGNWRRPAGVQLSCEQGADLLLKEMVLTAECSGQARRIPVSVAESGWIRKPVEPAVLADAVRRLGKDPADDNVRRQYQGFSWADANGDGLMQADEIRLSAATCGGTVLRIDDGFTVYFNSPRSGDYQTISPVGRTAAGYPVWDWANVKAGPETPFGQTRSLWTDGHGNVYQTSASKGDGYNHCWQWPATFVNATAVAKFASDGTLLWQSGERAGHQPHPRGQMHYPINTLGVVKNCVGFADYIEQPGEFWTEDGLYIGGVFDHRADDGLHPRVYTWFRHNIAQGDDYVNNLSLLQYDMLVGGNLAQTLNGDVLFFGAGWNNMPVFRITGFDGIKRQQGSVGVPTAVRAAVRKGTGLRAEYFANNRLDGEPVLVQANSSVWLGGGNPWPKHDVMSSPFSVRLTGTIEPVVGGPITFSAYAINAGVRVWIGGRKVLDQWSKPGMMVKEKMTGKYWTEPIIVQAGQRYPVRIEYRSLGKTPELHLNWEALDLPIEHIPTTALYPDGYVVAERPSVSLNKDGSRSYDAILDVRGEEDKMALDIKSPVPQWKLSGKAMFSVAHANDNSSLELLDANGLAIVSWYVFRGNGKPGITRPGHSNYMVFNDAEVDIGNADWARTVYQEQPFSITIQNGMARLDYASGITLERQILSGDASSPATLRVRASTANGNSARVRISDIELK